MEKQYVTEQLHLEIIQALEDGNNELSHQLSLLLKKLEKEVDDPQLT